jgi:hypothetical protein
MLLFFRLSEASHLILDKESAHTTVLSRRECGKHGRVPPSYQPGCPAQRATPTYSIHLIVFQNPEKTGKWASDIVVVLDLGTRGYIQVYFLAPPTSASFSYFTMATAFTDYCYKGLENSMAIPTTSKLSMQPSS